MSVVVVEDGMNDLKHLLHILDGTALEFVIVYSLLIGRQSACS